MGLEDSLHVGGASVLCRLTSRDGRAGLFCHRAGLERAGLTFVKPGWAGAGWAGLATTHKNRAAGFFPSIN